MRADSLWVLPVFSSAPNYFFLPNCLFSSHFQSACAAIKQGKGHLLEHSTGTVRNWPVVHEQDWHTALWHRWPRTGAARALQRVTPAWPQPNGRFVHTVCHSLVWPTAVGKETQILKNLFPGQQRERYF